MRPEERKTILVVGGREPKELHAAFTLKGLRVEECDFSDLDANSAPKRFAAAKAVLVAEPPGRQRVLVDTFERIAPWAVEEGVALGFLANTPEDLRRAAALAKTLPYLKSSETGMQWSYLQQDVAQLAEFLSRHQPGPGSGDARVTTLGKEFVLPASHQKLLRRAFWDAREIVVEKLAGGATSSGAYCVYASLDSDYGPQEPTPFVFKINTPKKSHEECFNYQAFVQPFVPFHLRPNLIEARCVQTWDRAALTCNFVEGAVPLEAALVNGHGTGIIHSLFETTLRRFRNQAHASQSRPGLLRDYVNDKLKLDHLRTGEKKLRIERAKALNFQGEPEDLFACISKRAEALPAIPVVIHGDLHVGNVMVRHRDSIVIDFGSMQHEGPVTADLAALEVSIAFGTSKEEDPGNQKAWFKFIDQLYDDPLKLPAFGAAHVQFAWISRAVRELRSIVRCCDRSEGEVRVILAASLMRYSRFSAPSLSNPALLEASEERKAYAMVKAQQALL